MDESRKRPSAISWVLAAVLAAVLFAALSATADASSRVCVYVAGPYYSLKAPEGRSITGHTFIQLLPDTGPQAGSKKLVYGFSTRNSAIWRALGGYGEVQDDSNHPWTWRMCSSVSQGQYDKVQAKVARDIRSPPNYHLFDFNCTDWVLSLVRDGNYAFPQIPRTGNRIRDLFKAALGNTAGEIFVWWYARGAIFSDPYSMELRFAEIGDGNLYSNSGLVSKNRDDSLPTAVIRGTTTPRRTADVDSPTVLGQLAVRSPQRFGRMYGIDPVIRQLDKRRVGVGDQLALEFDHVSDDRSLIAVDWDDAGRARFEDPDSIYEYQDPGVHHVRAVVLRGATLMHISFDVFVSRREDAKFVTVDVPRLDAPKEGPDEDDPVVPLPID